ncbi:bifunctional 2-polyprenyl-6-hydroxyphenol methylase/3-demethylubiquinol 3-O-methyltransferase UbiG [Nostoc sp. FACHB-190]|uniref:class I SAM-dependent methyltransferase n=1 Tax=Nostoc sp. FACHB-190 TaxID=2692838 RepID=UPI00168348BF|nr:methyltransferase domain-containing protein [Nostoc sp. FACHB-190]MBD2301419.1 methyltransferase domain-containing protein [Nostoc sp. FACHB-190]
MNNSGIGKLFEQLKKIYYAVTLYDYDLAIILSFLEKYAQQERSKCKILDVGCGLGKKLTELTTAGYQTLGVDVNAQIIESNQKRGLNCITVEDFSKTEEQFDIILMSHIIEHFSPEELKEFMDSYLDKLKMGGYLIIATPLLTKYFYDDFDHVKPYSPTGIWMVFGKTATQVQYYSRNKLGFKDLRFRRQPYRFTFVRGKYIRNWTTKIYQVIEFISALLCLISFGWLGNKDGWVGIFKKVEN